jgi:hypothetical protein
VFLRLVFGGKFFAGHLIAQFRAADRSFPWQLACGIAAEFLGRHNAFAVGRQWAKIRNKTRERPAA